MTGNQDTSTRHSLDSITLFENTHATNETDSNESCEETEDVNETFLRLNAFKTNHSWDLNNQIITGH